MAHASLELLFQEVKAEAFKAYAWGLRFFVAVECADGQWIALHADDQGHAGKLAQCWVDDLGNRGASCWRLYPDGPGPEAFYSYFEFISEEDYA